MISKASAVFVRISPRKVRYVIDLIRAKTVDQAQAILNGSPRRAGGILIKLLGQALDAAKKNSQLQARDLMVSKVLADGGPSMKRFRAATMGRANRIKKRTSHIQIELDLVKKRQNVALKPTSKDTKTKAVALPSGRQAQAPVAKKENKSFNKKTVGAR